MANYIPDGNVFVVGDRFMRERNLAELRKPELAWYSNAFLHPDRISGDSLDQDDTSGVPSGPQNDSILCFSSHEQISGPSTYSSVRLLARQLFIQFGHKVYK